MPDPAAAAREPVAHSRDRSVQAGSSLDHDWGAISQLDEQHTGARDRDTDGPMQGVQPRDEEPNDERDPADGNVAPSLTLGPGDGHDASEQHAIEGPWSTLKTVDLANLTGQSWGGDHPGPLRYRAHPPHPAACLPRCCGTPARSVLMIMFDCCKGVVAMVGKSLSPLWILDP